MSTFNKTIVDCNGYKTEYNVDITHQSCCCRNACNLSIIKITEWLVDYETKDDADVYSEEVSQEFATALEELFENL